MKNNRRQFISGLGKGALATAFINAPLWTQNVIAQTANKKAVFIYHPDGCHPPLWHPTQTGTNFTLPAQTNTLDPVKQHCIFLQGLDATAPGGGHEGQHEMLTGGHDYSIDYLISNQLGAGYPFKGIHLGVGANYNGTGRMSFLPGQIGVSPQDDPNVAFNSIFGNLPGVIEQQRVASILSTAKTEVARLRTLLGTEEKAKLDQHEQAIFEVEQRINDTTGQSCNTGGWNSQGFQNQQEPNWPPTFQRSENFDTVAKLQMDLTILALSCGMTPVVTLCMSHPVSPFLMPGQTEGNHNASHNGKNPNSPLGLAFTAYKQYYCGLLRYFIDRLNATPDTDGSPLLQNTLVFMGSELGDSNDHDHRNMPIVLAGGSGVGLTTGQALGYAPGTSHSRLLVSIGQKMGLNLNNFGVDGTGPLAGV